MTRADIDGVCPCRYDGIGVIGGISVSAESMLLVHVGLGESKWLERRQMRQYLYFGTSKCVSTCTLVLVNPRISRLAYLPLS